MSVGATNINRVDITIEIETNLTKEELVNDISDLFSSTDVFYVIPEDTSGLINTFHIRVSDVISFSREDSRITVTYRDVADKEKAFQTDLDRDASVVDVTSDAQVSIEGMYFDRN